MYDKKSHSNARCVGFIVGFSMHYFVRLRRRLVIVLNGLPYYGVDT